ncbi:MAG TPA: NADH-quinone oxidoreductase subunit NuoK [Syntrophomonadaceae bacterium]|jgi:NADH:ubiquinone oxidoreductase subunit K|nr:NADH-quinone oxidoreductase subunit NuoK [Syntrophomonadaceae bacterium]HRX20940.1 NADH-quinone oxidoreductase subunit NuoK [Syntrophomonadaceae bacterium]
MIGLPHYLLLGSFLFCIGVFGVLTRRNAIAVLMSIELMLNAVNINLVAANKFAAADAVTGQLLAVFVIVVAAAEIAVGLALIISIFRQRKSVELNDFNLLKW